MTLELKSALKLSQSRQTLAIAESCTGGLLTNRLTNISGSSQYLLGAIIAYSNPVKINFLKVSAQIIKKHGAVSHAACEKMSQNVRRIFKSDLGIGITGIAGPKGGSASKPVGLVYISLTTPTKTICQKFLFKGSRLQIKKLASDQALKLLLENL